MKTSQILLAKLESSEGVDPLLDGSNVIRTSDGITVTQYDGDKITVNVDSVAPSVGPEINKAPHTSWSFNANGSGSGAAGTPPAFGVLLQACGFVEAVESGSVSYTLSHNKSKTVTLVKHQGGKKIQKSHGCRGELSIDLSDLMKFQFANFKGNYIRPVEGGNPSSLTYTDQADPLPINKQNTVTVDFGGTPLALTGGSINFGGGVSYLNIPNQELSLHGEFQPTGQLTFLMPDLSVKNFYAETESHNGVTELPFSLVHGTEAGNIIEITTTRAQLSNLSETDINGEVGLQADIRFLDAPVITFK